MIEATVRKAHMQDVKAIHALMLENEPEGTLLPRTLTQLYGRVRDFFVLHDAQGRLIGCSALSIMWENLAEVRSLLIAPELRGAGGGHLLVKACLDEARTLGLTKVFALTYQVAFFERQGFHVVSKDSLPQKVWVDCIHCPKFPDCDEIAVLVELQ